MKNHTSWIWVLCCIMSSCKLDTYQIPAKAVTNSNGVATQLPHLWGASTTDKNPVYGLYRGFTYKNGVLCVGMRDNPAYSKNGDPYFMLKDITTGKTIWVWDDKLPTHHFNSIFENVFFQDNKMIFIDGSFHYCIDLESGKTIWKKRQNMSFRVSVTHTGDNYYINGILPETQGKKGLKDGVFKANVSNGQISNFVTPKYETIIFPNDDDQTLKGVIHYTYPLKINADTLLAIVFSEAANKDVNANWHSYIGLYNTTQKSWLYEKVELSNPEEGGTSGGFSRVINGDLVIGFGWPVTIGRFVVATSEWKWRNKFLSQGISTTDILVADNKVLVNDTDGILYCLNGEYGFREWELKANVTVSDLYFQDGIVYCIADKNLKAIEVATGKLLWDMPSPDIRLNKISDSWFQGFVTGVPAKDGKKGKIIATTDHSIYCFEAVK